MNSISASDGVFEPHARVSHDVCMDLAAVIILVVLVLVPAVVVIALFVWAARKDGQADRAVQARLGIRRRTRLGR
jgi:NADH:ubiquinone oxidoreductase subunit H